MPGDSPGVPCGAGGRILPRVGVVVSARRHSFGCFSLHIAPVLAQLERGNFFSSTITKHSFFPSIHDAVLHIGKEQRLASVSIQPRRARAREGERAAQPSPPSLCPAGGPQHQDVALQAEAVSPRSRTGKEGFATMTAPTAPAPAPPDSQRCGPAGATPGARPAFPQPQRRGTGPGFLGGGWRGGGGVDIAGPLAPAGGTRSRWWVGVAD